MWCECEMWMVKCECHELGAGPFLDWILTSKDVKIIVYKIFGARNSFILIEHIYLPIIINLLSLLLGIVFSKLLFIYFSSLTNEFMPFIELTGSYKDISFVEAVIAGFFIIIVSVATCYFYSKKYFKCIY